MEINIDKKWIRINGVSVERLDFEMPVFRRLSWVNDEANAVWEPVMKEITKARPAIICRAVQNGLFPCALLDVSPHQLVEMQRLLSDHNDFSGMILEKYYHEDQKDNLRASRYRMVVGKPERLEDFANAWRSQDNETVNELLGMPHCCRTFNRQIENNGCSLKDNTLAVGLNTAEAAIGEKIMHLESPSYLTTRLYGLNFELISYTPCSMKCQPSVATAKAWIEIGREVGFTREMDALLEILSWPSEWSSLHGISEIKTPVVKISSNTDPLAERYRIRLVSDQYPAEAASGLNFPFLRPKFAKITDSNSFKKGLSNPIPVLPESNEEKEKEMSLEFYSSETLNETFELIRPMLNLDQLSIKSFFLSNYFNIIELNNLDVGSGMNYCYFKSEDARRKVLAELEERTKTDPLLLGYLFEEAGNDLLKLNLKTCLISALSRDLLLHPEKAGINVGFDVNSFQDIATAVVIGFGGYMDYIIQKTDIPHIHISDMNFVVREKYIKNRLIYYQEHFPHKSISFSSGIDNKERLESADLVAITGSAFCNGTMDKLLTYCKNCKTVIVQGQSASVHPGVLFDRGVTMLSTTLKPRGFIDLAKSDFDQFKSLLEGKLPTIFLKP